MLTVKVSQEVSKNRRLWSKSSRFEDQNWNDVLDFMGRYAHAEESFLMPDEFCDILTDSLFSNHIYSYDQVYEKNQFDWILIHKGRLETLPLDFIENTFLFNTPVFANEVFVIFSQSKEVPIAYYKLDHLRSLQVAISRLRRKNFFNQLKGSMFSKGTTGFRNISETRSNSQSLKQKNAFGYQMSAIPLTWVATSPEQPFVNLGDALSPIVTSALSGLPVVHQDFKTWRTRLACAGTIAHGLMCGTVHLWGTGLDHQKHPIDPSLNYYKKPLATQFRIHALRGPFSAQTFRKQGIDAPAVYGDPIWFLPSIIEPAEKKYELGVIVHLSELEGLSDISPVNRMILRYKIPESLGSQIRIITTMTQPTFAALEAKTREITACKRIVSTSLHGLVIAEAYGIPCAYFETSGRGAAFFNLDDDSEHLDWRMRDFYKGVGLKNLFIYRQRRGKETDWDDVVRAIDRYWEPIYWSPNAFLESFPLPLAFNPLQDKYKGDRSLLEQIKL